VCVCVCHPDRSIMTRDRPIVTSGRRSTLSKTLERLSMRRTSNAAMEQAFETYKHIVFFATPPNGRIIKAYVDTILLLSTFMFAFAAGNVGMIEREDLFAADRDWAGYCTNVTDTQTTIGHSVCDSFILPSVQLATLVTITYVVLGSSVLVSILCYLSILFSEIDEDTRAHTLHLWWRLYQWPMHFAMTLLAVGMVSYGLTMELAARIVFINISEKDRLEGFVWTEIAAFNAVFAVVAFVLAYMGCAHIRTSASRKKLKLVDSMKESSLKHDLENTDHSQDAGVLLSLGDNGAELSVANRA